MTHVIRATNVNDAYEQGIHLFCGADVTPTDSRAGTVMELDGPVITEYATPMQRVLWDAHRDANPFFHLFESLWMLAGRNDVSYLHDFNKKIKDFSDDSKTFHGAYGHRWREHFGFDQLEVVIAMLRKDPTTRRCVLTMWDPRVDLGASGVDLPCNLMVKFESRNRPGVLDMIVFNRSNDMIWGAYGANSVHMSFLHEFVAVCAGLSVGTYRQISSNFHVYTVVWLDKVRERATVDRDLYHGEHNDVAVVMPLLYEPLYYPAALLDITEFCATGVSPGPEYPLIHHIATPLRTVWALWRANREEAMRALLNIPHQRNDWVMACRMWMERRLDRSTK